MSRHSPPPWEEFARDDPLFFIDPALGQGVTLEEFRAAGAALVDKILPWVGDLPSHERVLEIGCGVGRNLVHLADRFDRAIGVDVSPTMLRIAREAGLQDNVELHQTTGRDLAPVADESTDFVFSHLVFQHVDDPRAVEGNMREIQRVLKPGGAAALQFDTRARSLAATVAHRLPDPLLPRKHRRHMRRYRHAADAIRSWATRAGLTIEDERDPNTANHWLLLRRPA
jgi:ubiquinone/menaquinone biosynthesis C-methylase UbiE